MALTLDLFRGWPELIVGFNTFLPPGYHINVTDKVDSIEIKVTMPDATKNFVQHYPAPPSATIAPVETPDPIIGGPKAIWPAAMVRR